MKSDLPMISIDLISYGNGSFDAYIAHDCSSGAHYDKIDKETIGKYVVDLIGDLEKNYT